MAVVARETKEKCWRQSASSANYFKGEEHLPRIVVFLLIILVALTIYAWQIEPNWLEVTTVDVELFGLPQQLDGFTILHLSDLHLKRFGREQARLLEAIASHHYDMIAITGDLLDNPRNTGLDPVTELLDGLDGPVYFVFGNHDYHDYNQLTQELKARDITILANQHVRVRHNGTTLQVAGIHDLHTARVNPSAQYQPDLEAALANASKALPLILLSHSPAVLENYPLPDWGVDLVLAGHTHGGQIKIPVLGAPFTASGRMFDKYVEGLYRDRTVQMYINRGLGTSSLPLRFLSRPEVTFIRLVGTR